VYWCDRCGVEIPAAEVYAAGPRLMHRRGSDAGMLHGDEHEVRQLADTHEPSVT
jgi:hypothetical protein